ncbi:MAG: orotidine-5'-phosphate decarboxylase [Oscillospiraceae bacterium]|jgi:orotidine-5'-phosphate decarboxylase|nr:orotidine-5'-phosphate decarboxylase [Oscillospiraceae bacterium]
MPNPPREVIVPLDFPAKPDALRFLDLFADAGERPFVKIGMELFYAEGPSIVNEAASRGLRVFLDLKVCDIPNTARGAMASLAGLPIDMVNCHALGGLDMMRRAREGLDSRGGRRPLLLGVTILTSIDNARLNNELGIGGGVGAAVVKLAGLAKEAGLDGVVCAPGESMLIHQTCGSDFVTITPGVRFPDEAIDDQHRVVGPDDARRFGCNYIVVGRPINRAVDPVSAYRRYVRAFAGKD